MSARSRTAGRRCLSLLAVVIVMSGCGGGAGRAASPGAAMTPPARIVSKTPALTEILFALRLGDRVVGVTTYCDWPPEARELPKIGGYVNPSVEAILSLRPDLVLVTPAAGNRDAALAVRRAGVRLEVIQAETLEETYAAIERTAGACGVPGRGLELARAVRRRVEAAAAVARTRGRVKALFCLQLEPLIAAGPGTLPGELMSLAGGENVVREGRYPQVGIETVLAAAPEVILEARMDRPAPGSAERALSFWRRWPTIPAVRERRVFVFDATTALRPGPRVADAVEELASRLHAGPPSAPVS